MIDFEGLPELAGSPDVYNLTDNPIVFAGGISFSSNEAGEDLFLIKTGPPQNGFVPDDQVEGGVFDEYFLGTEFNDRFTNLTIDFAIPTAELSFQMADIDDDEMFTITAIGEGGETAVKVINAGDIGTGNKVVTTIGFSGLGWNIVQVVIEGERSGNLLGIAFDNFNTVRDVTVPVPAAAPLFAAGIAGFAALRRRRRRGA